MATMIPAECDLSKRPMSEQIVFSEIKKNLCNDWIVFHSFDYVTRDLNRDRWDGEIDFLLYHPTYGILILEVKGGTISYRNGQWYQNGFPMDPVEQAKRNKYAVMRLLQEKLKKPIPIKFAHCVCFPNCYETSVWPAEAQGIVLTGNEMHQIERFAKRVIEETHLPKMTGQVTKEEIMGVLAPFFEYGEKLSEKIILEEQQIFLLTEQQCAILDAFERFPRLLIQGCAGSGKTIMAIKKAIRLASDGKRVLLLCYNQLLAKLLKNKTKNYPGITAAPFFEFCIELLKIPEEQIAQYRSNPKLYTDVLPKLLKQYIFRHCFYYDAIVVDEGQDFTPEAWDAISMMIPEGGCFYIFYDGDQNIFTKELHLPDFGYPPVVLTQNCRNTKKIFDALKPYQSFASSIMDSAPEGTDVHVLHGDCRVNLEKELSRLTIQEKMSLKDVIILGAHTMAHTSLGNNPHIGNFEVVDGNWPPDQPNTVSFFTYMKYKGCESKVIVLLDVDDSDSRWSDPHGIYTAMSRATHQLIILKKA